jgi:predicted ATP-grasp superfamily ATP-dependent carboligase
MKATCILGGSSRVVVTIARSLRAVGVPVIECSIGKPRPSLHSNAVRSRFTLPDPVEGTDDALLRLVQQGTIDTIFACSDPALRYVLRNAALLQPRAYIGFRDPAAVHAVLDKETTLQVAHRCGISTPKTTILTSVPDGPSLSQITYPVVVKPRISAGGARLRVSYAQDAAQLQELIAAQSVPDGGWLVQEFCAGEGLGLEFLLWDGKVVAAFAHRRLLENPSSGGAAVVAASQRLDNALAERSLALLHAIRWNGVAMVE